ncbi:MAG: TonB family protein [Gammaproteobacteria bacterium]|nr:TonB family protein [Gammaproteobacteria bacterium]
MFKDHRNTAFLILVCFPVYFSSVLADSTADAFNAAFARYESASSRGDFKTAQPAARESYELGRQIFPESSKNVAALNYNYGLSLRKTGDLEDARRELKSALKRYELLYGKKSTQLVPVLMELGAANAERRKDSQQLYYYQRAARITKKVYGSESKEYGALLVRAGAELMDLSRSRNAIFPLEKGHRLLQKAVGPSHNLTAVAAYNLGRMNMLLRKPKKGERYLLSALSGFEGDTTGEMMVRTFLVSYYEEMDESEKATEHCLAIGRMQPEYPNQDYQPLHKKLPTYPDSAQLEGLSGSVIVEFTIDEKGFVRDPKVIETDHVAFSGAALKAIEEFRYAPRFLDGQPVKTTGVLHRVFFDVSD